MNNDAELIAKAMEKKFHELHPGAEGREADDWIDWLPLADEALVVIRLSGNQ